jgi:hypothetical protein
MLMFVLAALLDEVDLVDARSGELAPMLSSSVEVRFAIGATALTTELQAVMSTGTLSTSMRRLAALIASSGLA